MSRYLKRRNLLLRTASATLLVATLGLMTHSVVHGQEQDSVITSREQAASALDAMSAARWENGTWVEQLTPFYSLKDGATSRILILSRFSDAVTVEGTAIAATGARLDLGTYVVGARETVHIELATKIADKAEFQEGAVVLRFFGDTQMVQGWLVRSDSGGLLETAFEDPALIVPGDQFSFWTPTEPPTDAEPRRSRLVLFNASEKPVEVAIATGSKARRFAKSRTESLPPGRPYEVNLGGLSTQAHGRLHLSTPDGSRVVATAFQQT